MTRDKYSSITLIKRIFRSYLSFHAKKLSVAIFFMVVVAVCSALHVWLVKPALDEIFINKNAKMLIVLPIIIIGVTILKGIAEYFQAYLINSIEQKILNTIQLDLYKKLLMSDLAMLNKHSSGNLISHFTNDILNLKTAVSVITINFARESLTLVFLIGLMFYTDPSLAVIAFFAFPLGMLPIIKFGKRIKKIAYKTQDELCNYAIKMDETFRNIKLIKAYCTETFELNRARGALTTLYHHSIKAIKSAAAISPIVDLLGSFAIVGVIMYGGHQVLDGSLSTGGFFSFVVALVTAYKPMKSLANFNMTLQTGLASARRIFTLMDIKNLVETKDSTSAPIKDADITIKDLYFSHSSDKPTLDGVSIEIPQKKFTAIVGETGSGKSTLVDLLLKFYLPSKGAIFLGKQSINDLSTKAIRETIAVVNQDIMLFDGSVIDNIKYSNTGSSVGAIKDAAASADASSFISKFKNGYDTQIGQFGTQLSGGQRQKIAIARALLKKSKILIFDEATSSLDQISEQRIKDSIMKFKNKKTVIFITHRIQSIQDADVIYVLKDGKVMESGNSKKLLEKRGEYYRLYHKRTDNFKEIESA